MAYSSLTDAGIRPRGTDEAEKGIESDSQLRKYSRWQWDVFGASFGATWQRCAVEGGAGHWRSFSEVLRRDEGVISFNEDIGESCAVCWWLKG